MQIRPRLCCPINSRSVGPIRHLLQGQLEFASSILDRTTTIMASIQHFDYIVVGGGQSGCVVAARLHQAHPSLLIVLVEAGPMSLIILLSSPLSCILHCTARHSGIATSLLYSLRLRVVRSLTGVAVYVSPSNLVVQEAFAAPSKSLRYAAVSSMPSNMVPGHTATPLTLTCGARRLETAVSPTVVYSRILKNPSTGMTTRATALSMASQAQYAHPPAVEIMPSARPSMKVSHLPASSLIQT